MASSLENGRKLIQELVDRRLYYNRHDYLVINEAKDEAGNKAYKLSTSYVDCGMGCM